MALSLQERYISHLLRGAVVGRIRFTFPEGAVTMTVDRGMYGRVARAIDHGHIKVVSTNDPTELPPGSPAKYQPAPTPGGILFIKAAKHFGRDLEGDVV